MQADQSSALLAAGSDVPTEPVAPPSKFFGIVTILCTLAGWTSIPLFLKFFSRDIDYYNANGWRYGFSSLMWLPPLLIAHYRGKMPSGIWKLAIVPAIFNAAGQHAFGIAPYLMDPGLMVFSLRSQVIFVTIGAFIMFPAERNIIKSKGYLLGLAMVLIGTFLTLYFKDGGLGGATVKGAAVAIFSGAAYAAYALSVRKYMVGMNPLLAFAAVSQYTAMILVAIMVMFGKDHGLQALTLLSVPEDAQGWMAIPGMRFILLLLSAVIGIGMGHTFYFLSIQRLGLAVANSVVQIQPITVSICSMLIFGELLNGAQWGFGLMAVAGAGVILFAQTRRRPAT